MLQYGTFASPRWGTYTNADLVGFWCLLAVDQSHLFLCINPSSKYCISFLFLSGAFSTIFSTIHQLLLCCCGLSTFLFFKPTLLRQLHLLYITLFIQLESAITNMPWGLKDGIKTIKKKKRWINILCSISFLQLLAGWHKTQPGRQEKMANVPYQHFLVWKMLILYISANSGVFRRSKWRHTKGQYLEQATI